MRPDIEAIRQRCEATTPLGFATAVFIANAQREVMVLLAYIAELEDVLKAVVKYQLRHDMDCASLDVVYMVEHESVAPCDCGRDAVVSRVQAVWEAQ